MTSGPPEMGGRSARAAQRDRDVGSFDRRADTYERDWRSAFHAPVVAAAAQVALAALPHPAAVLDVGCGTGALLRTLADRLPAGVALSGVDPAPAMLEVGRAALRGPSPVRMAQAVAERLPFRDDSFDLVVSTVSFADWSDQPAGLTEVARVLRPAGRLVLVDLFAIGWLRPITTLGRRRDRVRTAAELEAMLTRARLAPLAWRRVYDLGPLPLVWAVVAAHQPGTAPGAGYRPGGNR
jgi:ubiquinone/menaquinone biosynthesis C-methylase UbiE